jgi:periplasmic divalent cation tolerance protein
MVVMYTSAPSMEEAKKIASNLVSNKLAACVNIIPQILSVYEWKGNIENGEEFLLMIKVSFTLGLSTIS